MLVADAKEKAGSLLARLARCSSTVEQFLKLPDTSSFTEYQILINSLFSESRDIEELLRGINKDIHADTRKK